MWDTLIQQEIRMEDVDYFNTTVNNTTGNKNGGCGLL